MTTSDADHSDPRVERTRTAVLAAGTAILFEHGPERISHAAIATAARVSRTTLYKYWPTRADLIVDILDQIEPHKPADLSGNLREDLLVMTAEMAGAFADPQLNRAFSSMMAQAHRDDDTSRAQQMLIEAGMADMGRILDAGVANGQVRPGLDPARAAGQIIGPMFFAAMIVRQPMSLAEAEANVDEWLESVKPD